MNHCANENWSVSVHSGSDVDGHVLQPTKRYGYSRPYFNRPNGFIYLRLSPASRQFLRSKPEAELFQWLTILCGKDAAGQYWMAVQSAGYMERTRSEWADYIYRHDKFTADMNAKGYRYAA